MLPRHHDPIVAVATAPGRAGIGIVRLSGADLAPVVEAVCQRTLLPRQATYLSFHDADGSLLDRGIALHFPAPHSATGEDVLELHAHGGPVLLQLLLARCLAAGAAIGLRIAQPGEFSERAFLNDKLDLAQAEAVADLIDASTVAAARSAARSLDGAFSRAAIALHDKLVDLRLLIEATLDFPEEEIDLLQRADARGRLAALAAEVGAVLARTEQGALLRDGLRVAIVGQPNAGKSTLLNALAGAEVAIVTPVAGTTRDAISQQIQLGGLPIVLVDTAGLRDTDDPVERIGIARAWQAAASADAVLFLHDLSRAGQPQAKAADADVATRLAAADVAAARVLHVHTKADLADRSAADVGGDVVVSAHTGAGLDALRVRLLQVAGVQPVSDGSYTARARHVAALREARLQLQRAAAQLDSARPALDLCAEDLRLAQAALAALTGAVSSDELLGAIFSRFCIGK